MGTPNENDDDMISPEDGDNYKTGERYRCRAGRKLFAVTGHIRDTAASGTEYIDVKLVCLKDYEKPGQDLKFNAKTKSLEWVKVEGLNPPSDEGLGCRLKFHNTEKARPRFANFAREMGRKTPFSFKNDDHVADILTGPQPEEGQPVPPPPLFIGTVKVDIGDDGKEWPEVEAWERYEGERDPAWDALFDKGITDFEESSKRREENKERRARSGGDGGSGRRRSGGGGKGYGF